MNLNDLDVVYFVKECLHDEELRYSLRSVDINLPHRNVWFIGGCPENIEPDRRLYIEQNECTKWDNTSKLLKAACECREISDNFILFNDDFFVMKPVDCIPYYSNGSIESRVQQLKQRYGNDTQYSRRLKQTIDLLEKSGYTTISYAVHFPMIINKHEMLQTFEQFPEGLMWRSIYGNHHHKSTTHIVDCKINSTATLPNPNWTFVSTQDSTFEFGLAGKYIRKIFTVPSKFEK